MGRSNDGIIPVNNEEWCFWYSTQTKKQECGIFKVDLQDKTCDPKMHDRLLTIIW